MLSGGVVRGFFGCSQKKALSGWLAKLRTSPSRSVSDIDKTQLAHTGGAVVASTVTTIVVDVRVV